MSRLHVGRVLFFAVATVALLILFWLLDLIPDAWFKAVILGVGGPALVVGAPLFLIAEIRFRGRAVRTTGTVTRCVEGGPEESTCALTIEFATLEGRRVTFTEDRLPCRKVGSEVPVLYDPGNPDRAHYRHGPLTVVVTTVAMLAIGAVLSAFAWDEYLRR